MKGTRGARRYTSPQKAEDRFVVMRLDSIRRAFRSDAAVAEALGVDRTQLTRWRQGQVPDPRNLDRLLGLDAVVQLLTGFLSTTTIPKWLRSPNPRLGDRSPLYLLRHNRLPDVIAAIQTEKSGAFG